MRFTQAGGLTLLLLFASPVNAQEEAVSPEEAEAREHFAVATNAFDVGDYELAIREFRRAHELSAEPELLFNIYMSAERLGRLQEAESALAGFLAEADLDRERRTAMESRLARIRARTAETEAAAPGPAPEPAPASGGGIHPLSIGLLVGGGALLVNFAIFAGLAVAEDAAIADECGENRGAICADDRVGDLEAFNVVADISWIAGAAVAAAGLILLFVLPGEGSDGARADLRLAPWASSTGAGLSLGGTL